MVHWYHGIDGMVPEFFKDGCSTNLIDVSRRYIRLQPGEVPAQCCRVPDVAGDEPSDLSLILYRLSHRHWGAFRESPVKASSVSQMSHAFVKLNG